jgi:glutathione S-transferase
MTLHGFPFSNYYCMVKHALLLKDLPFRENIIYTGILARFEPYIAGSKLTLADITLRYVLALPKAVGAAHLEWDVFAEVPGLAEWDAMMADSDISRQLDQQSAANFPVFIAAIAA